MFYYVKVEDRKVVAKGCYDNETELSDGYLEISEDLYWQINDLPCDYVIEYGKITEVTSNDQAHIKKLKQEKIFELKENCNSTILSGFEYNNEKYNMDYEDQINMEAIKNNLLLGLISECEYYPAGQPCRVYSRDEFLGLYSTGMSFKTSNIQRCKALIEQVEKCYTEESIEKIGW